MKKVFAIAVAVFSFASQVSAGCSFSEYCPIDGASMLRDKCEWNFHDNTQTCFYSHTAIDGSTHSFYKTGCN